MSLTFTYLLKYLFPAGLWNSDLLISIKKKHSQYLQLYGVHDPRTEEAFPTTYKFTNPLLLTAGPNHDKMMSSTPTWNFVPRFFPRWLFQESSFLEEKLLEYLGSISLGIMLKSEPLYKPTKYISILRRHWKGLMSTSPFLQNVLISELKNGKTLFYIMILAG